MKDKVYNVFSEVAPRYDLMNDFMSLGIHRLWKRNFVKQIDLRAACKESSSYYSACADEIKMLDIAGGTGDIAKYTLKEHKGKNLRIILSDINIAMLQKGIFTNRNYNKKNSSKLSMYNDEQKPELICADAQNLPFKDNTFNIVTIVFGIRNVNNRELALQEMLRVLKPGGQLLCMEFGKVHIPIWKQIYGFYSKNIIPLLGALVAGNRSAYQYLVDSIGDFPSQETFKAMICNAGFDEVTYENLWGGITAIHSARKKYL